MLLLLKLASAETIEEAFPPPSGERVATEGYGASLKTLELRAAEVPVRTHDGREVNHQARVVELPLVPGDLQQCADSLIRLRATWELEQEQEVVFHATSGDALPWARYRDGETPYVVDDRIAWKTGGTGQFEDYLAKVFMWAGTHSLEHLDTVPTTEVVPGSMLIQGGFPGHAVVLLDVAVSGDKTYVLVGEGYMPAQDFHVELGPHSGWWLWEEGLPSYHWPMKAANLRAFD
ncbi:MAG TPA: DUF4846 domain-containing protein [Myxococcota bacterium]|nr:DUF4846 domain-containing protein [Myxococcota bacterium]